MTRRLFALAAAAAALASGLSAGPASADATCVTTDEGPFEASVVCAAINSAFLPSFPVPYSVGSVCVAGQCTPAQTGTLYVPIVNPNVVQLYGTVCVRPTKYSPLVCRSFDSAQLLGPVNT